MIDQSIRDFPDQFSYEPVIENAEGFKKYSRFVVCGMGGSHLPANLLKRWHPDIPLIIHSDYGLPPLMQEDAEHTLFIPFSFSGNTEETLSSFDLALRRKLPLIAIATGGSLIKRAQESGVPYIQLPNTGIQPRMGLGLNLRALFKAIGDENDLIETKKLTAALHEGASQYEERGRDLAKTLQGRIPVIYSSTDNFALAYNWKIKFNETGKIPAFYNVLPELNHNEMTGFDRGGDTKQLSEQFYFIFITDANDNPHIQKRMSVLQKLYEDRGLSVLRIPIEGETLGIQLFSSLLTADWAAFYLANYYHVESEQVPMVEEFKRLIA